MNQAVIIFRAEQDNCALLLMLSPPYAGIFPAQGGLFVLQGNTAVTEAAL